MKKCLYCFVSALCVLLTAFPIYASAMQISVTVNVSGVTDISLEVESGDSIETVKQKIYDEKGYPVSKQRLMFNGTVLKNEKTLADLNIQKNSVLTLSFETFDYTVEFDANGGNGTMPSQSMTSGKTATLTANSFVKPGFKFNGWNTQANGKGVKYSDKQSVTDIVSEPNKSSVTLYAQWKQGPANTLRLNGNGGLRNGSATYSVYTNADYYEMFTSTEHGFVREGYTFVGWNTEPDGNGSYVRKGDFVRFDVAHNGEIKVLYAQWERTDYTLLYATRGGTQIENKTNIAWNDKVLDGITAPTFDGFEFIGWEYITANGDKIDVTTDTTYGELAEDENILSITVWAKWKDITPPTGEITVGENKWNTFEDNVDFNLFFDGEQTVEIYAADNMGYLGAEIEYSVSNARLSKEELENTVFTPYAGAFKIDSDNEYVVYAKVTDNAGNVTYISTNGFVIDSVSPVIGGVEDGGIYCTAQTVTVAEKHIASVTVNGETVLSDENNQFIVSYADGEQKIVVTDKAGNKTEITVTVKGGHIGGTATCKNKAICEICACEYGEPDTNNHINLEYIKATVPGYESEGNTEYWYCNDCGKYFADENGKNEIKLADTVTDKLERDDKDSTVITDADTEPMGASNSAQTDNNNGNTLKNDTTNTTEVPKTGDTFDTSVWVVLALISIVAFVGIKFYGKKEKYFSE